MMKKEALIIIELQPMQLFKGDNHISVVVRNMAQSTCRGLNIRLRPSFNLLPGPKTSITFMPILPGQIAEETVILRAVDVGSAKLILRCTWFQQNEDQNSDILFTLDVKEKVQVPPPRVVPVSPIPQKKQPTLSREDEAFLRELLAQYEQNRRLLLKQKSVFGAGAEPLHLLNQINDVEKEIAKIKQQLGEA